MLKILVIFSVLYSLEAIQNYKKIHWTSSGAPWRFWTLLPPVLSNLASSYISLLLTSRLRDTELICLLYHQWNLMESLQLWPSSIAEFISENATAMIRFIENCVFYSPEQVHVHSFPAQFFICVSTSFIFEIWKFQ